MSIRDTLKTAVQDIGTEIKSQVLEARDQIRSDRSKIEELETYLQSIFDIAGKHNDTFEAGQQSIALQVGRIIGYESKDKA